MDMDKIKKEVKRNKLRTNKVFTWNIPVEEN